MIFTDVFGQTQVMQLVRPERRRPVTMVTKAGRVVTTETHIMWKGKKIKKQSKHFHLLFDVIFETHPGACEVWKAKHAHGFDGK